MVSKIKAIWCHPPLKNVFNQISLLENLSVFGKFYLYFKTDPYFLAFKFSTLLEKTVTVLIRVINRKSSVKKPSRKYSK